MGAIPFAFSVHHFISSVGADAGFAAIIGLALLILLYFAQARETASLRERAADSAEQVQQLELRLAALARSQASSATDGAPASTSAPVPPPPGIVKTAGAPAFAAAAAGSGSPVAARTVPPTAAPVPVRAPAAPAGVAAPALSAATRLIPTPDRDQISIRAGTAGGVADEELMAATSGATVIAPPGPPPSTAAGGANGSVSSRVPPLSPGPMSAQPGPRAPVRRADAASGPAAPSGRRPAVPTTRLVSSRGERRGIGRTVMILVGLLALAAIAVVVVALTAGGGKSSSSSASAAANATRTVVNRRHRNPRAAAPLTPRSVTVAVLNGTSTTNLAHTIAARLAAVGYKQGTVATASDQTQTATVVGYLPHQRRAALIVAKSLNLGSASVQPVDQSNQTVACPVASTPCSAQVVVTVGSDLASNT